MDTCIFCKIIARELPASIVYEDDRVVAFLDIFPVAKGHTLIVPKVHNKNFLETDDAALSYCLALAKKIMPVLMKTLASDGCSLSLNTGSSAGQSVFHTHIHLIPRTTGDGLKMWPHLSYEEGEKDLLAEKLSISLNSH